MKEYYDMETGITYYKDFLDTYGFTHLLVYRGELLQTELAHDPDDVPVYEDDTFLVYRLK